MACTSIGEANPDIAGIGILVAFVIQSLVAVFVSYYTFILSTTIREDRKDTKPDDQSPIQETKPLRRSTWNLVVGQQPKLSRRRTGEHEISPTTKRLEFANKILLAGNDAQTFTGIALLISALVQSKTLSLYHMHILYDAISLVVISNCAASACIFSEGRHKGYTRLVLIAIWTILFISYFGVFATRLQQWDEDTPLHCYRTSKIARPGDPHPRVDRIYIGFTFFYILSSIFYAIKLAFEQLSRKDRNVSQTRPRLVRSLTAQIPEAAVAIVPQESQPSTTGRPDSSLLTMARLLYSMQANPVTTDAQNILVGVALLQCPLHIYSIFALRSSNEKYLEAGSAERDWGFGQIVAMVLLGANILSIADGITGFIEESEDKLKRVATNALLSPDVELALQDPNVAESAPPKNSNGEITVLEEQSK